MNYKNQEQINREQEYIHNKGHDALAGLKRVRSGEHKDKAFPSTDHADEMLQKGESTLEHMQQSNRSSYLNSQGRVVVDDVHNVLSDEREFMKKNDGDVVQNIIVHAWHLFHDISNTDTTSLMALLEDWQNVLSSVCETPEFGHLLQASGHLLVSLRSTEEFLTLASEMINLIRLLVVETTEKLTDRRENSITEYRQQKDVQKKQIKEQVSTLLKALSRNKIWIDVFKNGKSFFSQYKNQAVDLSSPYQEADKLLDNPNLDGLIENFHTLLQRLVGDRMNVEDLFRAVSDVLHELLDNKALKLIGNDAYTVLESISENSLLLDDVYVKSRLQTLRMEGTQIYYNFLNGANMTKLKGESRRLLESIKSEPVNQKLINDVVKLWKDVKSDNPRELVDANLLTNIRQVLRPMLLEHLNNIPLPDIHDTKDFMGRCTFNLENIKLSAPALIPENIHIKIYHDMDADTRSLSATNMKTYVDIEAHDMHICVHNVKWSYERLSSPHFSDEGLANVKTTGKGIILRLKAELKMTPGGENMIEMVDAKCYIDGFGTEFSNSKHDVVYKMLSSLFSSTIKKEVIKTVESKLMDLGNTMSSKIAHILKAAQTKSNFLSDAISAHHESSVHMLKNTGGKLRDHKEQAITKLKEFNENPVTMDLKEDAKLRGRGGIVIASERAISLLDQQKLKIEEKKADLENKRIGQVQEQGILKCSADDPFSNEMYDFLEMHTLTPPLSAHHTPSSFQLRALRAREGQNAPSSFSLDSSPPSKSVIFDENMLMVHEVGSAYH